ncbi:sigma-70 family RNA polymerase sigma factor [Fulvivirgaceae bacterium BMA10]|uniref:Sigma-70 family RNA polymerase sigma factor n=1 Tax=Splendidivirga corallicola TaxID=3051826 RepID=A0ABT8KM79_9BACT|nr:sigma-70 family RNA polymerase sigma factor [Fulvivirgaceae bacterium BMA10]
MEKHFFLEDQRIIDAIQSGTGKDKSAALKELYRSYFPLIKNFILKNKGRIEDVEDIYQETLLVVYNQIKSGKFRGDSSLKTFIYVIARNIWFKELRKHSKQIREISEIEQEETIELPLADLEHQQNKIGLIEKLIELLSEDCKAILLDFYYNNLGMKDIMSKFNLGSEQAAKNKKYRCLQSLIKLVTQKGITLDYIH